MISYEELCEALDRFNSRRRNAAELEQLEQTGGSASAPRASRAAPGVETFSLDGGFAEQPKEDTHEIDVDDMEPVK